MCQVIYIDLGLQLETRIKKRRIQMSETNECLTGIFVEMISLSD